MSPWFFRWSSRCRHHMSGRQLSRLIAAARSPPSARSTASLDTATADTPTPACVTRAHGTHTDREPDLQPSPPCGACLSRLRLVIGIQRFAQRRQDAIDQNGQFPSGSRSGPRWRKTHRPPMQRQCPCIGGRVGGRSEQPVARVPPAPECGAPTHRGALLDVHGLSRVSDR